MAEASESAAQRRLWLLQRLLEKMDAEEALKLAARMEAFVTADGQMTLRKDGNTHPGTQKAPVETSPAQVGTAKATPDSTIGIATEATHLLNPPHLDKDSMEGSPEPRPAFMLGTGVAIADGCERTGSVVELKPTGTVGRDAGRLLNEGELQAFTNRAVQGATNRDLARLFGLTPRQANGIRMALAKRNPQVALRFSLDA